MLFSFQRFLRQLFCAALLLLSLTAGARAEDTPPATEALKILSAADLWKKGNEALSASKWDDARDAYLELVERKELSAQLFNNLGVAERKREQTGEAVMWFSRAVALDPRLPEAKQNLDAMGVIAEEGINRFSTPPSMLNWVVLLRSQVWKVLIWSTGWVMLIAIVWLVWWTPRRLWPVVTLLSVAGVGMSLAIIGLGVRVAEDAPLSKRYVVLARGVAAYAAPAEKNSTMIISLPAGSSVLPLETRGNWRYCEFPVGKGTNTEAGTLRGWVRESWIAPLWPWDPALVD